MKHRVRTTMQPDQPITVGDAELRDLERQNLIAVDPPPAVPGAAAVNTAPAKPAPPAAATPAPKPSEPAKSAAPTKPARTK